MKFTDILVKIQSYKIHHSMKCLLFTIGILLSVLTLVSCTNNKGNSSRESSTPGQIQYPIKITTTIGMITDIVKNVGGEYVEVKGLMGPGIDPHLYKANERDIRDLSDADIIFYNGLNLEGKLGDLFVKMARKKPTIPVSENIDETTLREPPEFLGHYDPHIWFDVSLWMKAVESVRNGLSEYDPAHKDEYMQNATTLIQELQALHEWCKIQIAQIPRDRRTLITAHDAFGYFGRAYDIEVKGIQGISTESEASVKKINELVDEIVTKKVKAVFVESSVPQKNVEALVEGCQARGHQIRIGGTLFSDAMGADGTPEGTYIGMVKYNVNTIVNALK